MTKPAVDVRIATQPAPKWLSPDFIEHLLEPQASQWLEVHLACVDYATMAFYNNRYRQGRGATDVLSFAFPEELGLFGGQIFLYHGAIETYAQRARLPSDLRWAHLIAHSLAHLQGLDHQTPEQAQKMWEAEQKIWRQIIAQLPHLKDWEFTALYQYYYKNTLVHQAYPS